MSTSALSNIAMLPASSPEELERLNAIEQWQLDQGDWDELPTEHVIHAGMYARSIVMKQGQAITGSLVKLATLVIVTGSAVVEAGGDRIELHGYNVLPAAAGRKQLFMALSTLIITMVFPTQAKTVEEAEREVFAQADQLLSRRQNVNQVVITEES